jgi:hypothetical protein
MDVDTQRRKSMPPKRIISNVHSLNEERETDEEIELTNVDVLGRDNMVSLSTWVTQPEESIDLSNDEPLQGVVVKDVKFDRGMLKEVIAGIVAIAFSLLFYFTGYPALILPLLGMIAAYYFGSRTK